VIPGKHPTKTQNMI